MENQKAVTNKRVYTEDDLEAAFRDGVIVGISVEDKTFGTEDFMGLEAAHKASAFLKEEIEHFGSWQELWVYCGGGNTLLQGGNFVSLTMNHKDTFQVFGYKNGLFGIQSASDGCVFNERFNTRREAELWIANGGEPTDLTVVYGDESCTELFFNGQRFDTSGTGTIN